MMLVREATRDDVGAVMEMGRAMHAESPSLRGLDYDEAKVLNLIEFLIANPNSGGVLVAEIEGKIGGMLLFFVAEHFFGKDKYASDLCVYLRPEHRGGRGFLRLIRAFETRAGELGVAEKLLGISTGVHPERTAAALTRLGYDRATIGLRKV